MLLALGLHGGVDVLVDDEGLSAHPDVSLGDDLSGMSVYIDDFSVLLKDVEEGIFEFVDGYFFIEIANVDRVVGSMLLSMQLYSVAL